MKTFLTMSRWGLLTLVSSAFIQSGTAQQPNKPLKVDIVEVTAQAGDGNLAADPAVRVEHQYSRDMELVSPWTKRD